jgi:hypothetical protein
VDTATARSGQWGGGVFAMVTFIVLIINYEFQKLKYVFAMEE